MTHLILIVLDKFHIQESNMKVVFIELRSEIFLKIKTKGFICLFLVSLLLSTKAISQQYNWLGSYSFSKNYGKTAGGTGIVVSEQLIIENSKKRGYNYSWKYEVSGYQTFYLLKGYAIDKGGYVDFYLSELADGVYYEYNVIDNSKPFFKMKFQNNQVLTKWIQPKSQKDFRLYFVPD